MLLELLNFTSLICQVKSGLDGKLVSICIYLLWSKSWHIVVVVTSRRYLGSERWFVSTERCPRSIAGGLPNNTDWQHQFHYKEHLQVSDSRWNHNKPLAVSQCFTSSPEILPSQKEIILLQASNFSDANLAVSFREFVTLGLKSGGVFSPNL